LTKRIGNLVVIEPEEDDICQFCGKLDELRPYGPNRERICYDCAMKDKATTDKVFARDVLGIGEKH
jgi:hypothetical protein